MFSRPIARSCRLTRAFSTQTHTPITTTSSTHVTMSTSAATQPSRKPSIPIPTVTHVTPPKPTPSPPSSSQQQQPQQQQQYNDAELVGKNGGQIFVEMMKQHGVKHIFGYPGGAILPIFDGIHGCKDFDFILPRHEQGAGHMAEGYARATGRPGIVLVTSGPGATNTITPMQDALSDGTPMIVFTGQVATTAIGSDAFQEADVLGISRSCTKWNTMVRDIADLPRAIREAFHIATSGRPGPVLVDLPKDVTSATLTRLTSSTPTVPYYRRQSFNNTQIQAAELSTKALQAAQMINNAKRPLLYVGQGALDSSELLRELAIKGNIPVTTTLQGMGCFDELHPLSVHMLGMHGSAYANLATQHADVIISIGARFDDRVTGMLKKFAPAAKKAAAENRGGIIHLDILSKNINKVVPVDIAMIADAGDSMRLILPHIKHVERTPWLNEINEWKKKYPFEYKKNLDANGKPTGVLKPQAVLEELNKQLSGRTEEVIFTTGVGQHQMWAAQYIRWRHPRTMITSGGLGTMGFGLPAAIGAKVGAPDKIVIDIDGDASFSMTGMELATAAEFNVGVKVLLLNNNFQGMVKQWQDLFYQERYSGTVMKNPEWVKMAEAFHCTGLRVTTYEDLPAAISKFLACEGPVILDAVVCDKEHVYPMVPAGKGLDEMVLGPGKALSK